MIKTQLRKLVNSVRDLSELSTEKISPRFAFTVGLVLREAQVKLDLYNDMAKRLFSEYAEGEGETKTIPVSKAAEFKAKMDELDETEIELNIGQIDVNKLVSEFEKAGLNLSASLFYNLDWLLTGELKE